MKKTKVSETQLYLTVLYVACLMVSNTITSKQIQLPFDIVMTGGALVFPVTYILSDVFSEIYGYRWSRVTCYLAFAINLLMVGYYSIALVFPSPDYWDNQAAFEAVLGNTPRVLVASVLAFVAGDFINDKVFSRMKAKHPDSMEKFGARAILSSLVGEMVDSSVFMPIVFLGEMPISVIFQMMVTEVLIKTGYEVVILPLTRLVTKKVMEIEHGETA